MTQAPVTTRGECFICRKEIPFSARYPEKLCEDCMKKAINKHGEKLSFHNESASGGFISVNETTKTEGKEHVCYVNGYECYADEAYMGGIVLVPAEQAKEKKRQKQKQHSNIRNIVILICAILAPAAIWGAYAISRNGYFDIGFTLFDALIIIGSVSLLLFFSLTLYRYKVFLFLATVLYAATGFFTTYTYGYRNDAFLDTIAIISLICAVLLLTFLILSTSYISKRTKELQERKQTGNNAWVLLIIVPILILIAGYIFIAIKGEEVAERLIETAPGASTIATVKEVQQYSTRTRTGVRRAHNEAMLEYTVNGNTFYRILDNATTQYSTGSKISIRYVIADPYLIKVSTKTATDPD